MSKKTIKFRVESRLLAQFNSAALKAGRSPTEILVEFMTNYVREARASNLVDVATSTSSEIKANDEKVVDFAYAFAQRKLVAVQKEVDYHVQRFFNGEVD